MKPISEMRRELAEKAAADESFRTALIADPRAVVARECGVTIPENFEIAVLEDSADVAHLILSPSPELSAEDLQRVAGAGSSANDYDDFWTHK